MNYVAVDLINELVNCLFSSAEFNGRSAAAAAAAAAVVVVVVVVVVAAAVRFFFVG